jgi:predicted permease
MGQFIQEFRYALRLLIKSPGFTIIAILTLALGIGANSTIFSWINSTILNPIPGVTHTSEYVALTAGPTGDANPISYPDYMDLRDRTHSLSSFIAYSLWPMDFTANAKPERVWGCLSSANYFDALGVHPVLGRGFLPDEGTKPGSAPVVVLSYPFWQTHFASDLSIIGGIIQINKRPFTIVGVAPPVFQGTETGVRADIWLPMVMVQPFVGGSTDTDILKDRGTNWIMTIGHLNPGITREQAQSDMSILYDEIAKQYPDSHKDRHAVTLHPLWRGPFGSNYYLRTILFLLMAISFIVLLLACANVANLLLVRAVGRRKEMAIRLSVGATRWRLVRQLFAESLILALGGGGIAMLFTLWSAGTLSDFVPPSEIPISMNIQADRTVLLATLGLSLVTAVLFGVLPALRSSKLIPSAVLKEESGGGDRNKARLSSILVVAQIAMSLLLLVCAGLFIRSFTVAQQCNPGFNPHNVLLDSYDLVGAGYDQKSGPEFHRQLLAKLQALPGVQSVALANWVPLGFSNMSTSVEVDGYAPRPNEAMEINVAYVGPDYLHTMQIPVAAGREFALSDTDKSQLVAIVNQEFARRYWPNQDPLGKLLRARSKSFTVVGIAQNSDTDSLKQKPKPFLYLPLFQLYDSNVAIHARVAGNPLAYVSAVQNAVHQLDADLPLYDLMTLDSRIQLNTTNDRIGGVFVGAFGLLALVLAAVGVYGVLAYTTRQRTRELGIRMALGADPRTVFGVVLRQGAILAMSGILIGLAASLLLTRALSSTLFGVSPTDPLTFIAVSLLLLLVALLACYIPARRAMRTDPLVALRYE